ncbi:MAG: histidine phosphatase family protein [Candidatus Tectomicrobia bacterium]|nr:histidine phosphatase family protein [Candidatus Tectomicrobia bacterium]
MGRIYLLRHGETEWNRQRRVMGSLPIALSDTGVQQARALAEALARRPLAAVYSSPLRRAMETAEILAAPHGLAPVPVPGFTELPFGEWEGKSWDELRLLRLYQDWRADPTSITLPGGGTIAQVQERAVAALERLRAAHPEQRLAVVSHAEVIKCLLCHYLGITLKFLPRLIIDNGTISTFSWGEDGVRVVRVNALPAAVAAQP